MEKIASHTMIILLQLNVIYSSFLCEVILLINKYRKKKKKTPQAYKPNHK